MDEAVALLQRSLDTRDLGFTLVRRVPELGPFLSDPRVTRWLDQAKPLGSTKPLE